MVLRIILSLIAILIVALIVRKVHEGFIDPVPSNSATTKTGEGDQMNANWRQILMYLQQNPQNSTAFLQYLQNTFFEGSTCTVKAIDFRHLADTYTPLFT
jgi:hypothetical protein